MSVGGTDLEFRSIQGDASKPTLVLLHEGLGCVALWRDFPDRLAVATGQAVFAYSRAGYGGSDPVAVPRPLDYMTIEAIDVLPHVLNKANIGGTTLIGHSDGASIALVYAGKIAAPGLCSVVAIAPHVFAEQFGIDSITTFSATFHDGELRRRLEKYHGSNVDCAFQGWSQAWLDPRFLQWTIVPHLAGIEVPVLQIQGLDDEYGTARQLRCIESAIEAKVDTLLLDACGHAPHQQCSDKTLTAITEFCQATALHG
jgi:pimeloyl-ACP methyl ester carboxylesterase